jgi:tRNA threonylcarbamoyladenosine biosynthesis protein TsaB
MLILSIDTSGRQGSMALARGAGVSCEVLELVPLAGGMYSALLIPELTALLSRHNLQKTDLEGFAVVSGPGSFTGLRVGLAAIKGLAEILQCPVAAVSMLEAIAAQANCGGEVIAALDAGRKEVFAGEYALRGGEASSIRETLLSREQFSALLTAHPKAELVTPDAVIAELATTHLQVRQITWPDAGEIARLGFSKLAQGQMVAPEALEANYIRRSDAEIFSAGR